jgi:hypothetical protein
VREAAVTLYAVLLQATTDDRASVHALRAVLKLAKRRGLLAVEVRELPSTDQQTIRRRDAQRRIANQMQRCNEVITMAINLKKYGPTKKWLNFEDLHDKPPIREHIGLVKVDTSGKFGERIVLTLVPSGQMLSLNKTSVGNLLRDFGESDDDWLGKPVEVYAGEVQTNNGPTDAILVRGVTDAPTDTAIATKAVKAAKAKTKSSDMDDEISF